MKYALDLYIHVVPLLILVSVSFSVIIGYIDLRFGKNDNISIGIGYYRLYRLQFWMCDNIGIGIGYNRLYRVCLGQ